MIRLNNPQYIHFLQQADTLRRSGSLCDAIISVKNHTFHAHRLVLACASRKLAQQLFWDGLDSPVQCTLEVISPHTFQQVLDFTYTQTLEVSVEDLSLLLKAAQLLEMQPLEEQCRKQLNTLEYNRNEDRKKGVITEHNKQPAKDAYLREKEIIEDTQEENDCILMEKNPTPDCVNNPHSPEKKPRLSPMITPCSRDSVITTSGTHFTSPWTFPANMWNSVDTLRKIAQNYSTLISAYPLPNPNQTSVAFPLSLPAHHVFPLIPSPFQRPVQSTFMSYSRLHPHYSQNMYTGPTGVGSIIRQGLLKRKKQKALTETTQARDEPSYINVAKTSTGKAKDCQHCAARLISDPVSQEPASPKTGCMFCRRNVVQHDPQSHQQEHRVDKPYQCKHCPKKFSLKHQLDTHHRVHTGEKPFECRLCGQRSRDYSAMIKHLRTHGGAAPYQCTVCLEFCNSLVAMQRHVKSHSVQDFPSDWSISSTYLYTSHI